MKRRALVIVQEDGSLDHIDRVLVSLGHDYDRAACQEEAQWLIELRQYDYIVADLLMCARSVDGDPHLPACGNLLDRSGSPLLDKSTPLILLVGFSADSLPFHAEMCVVFASIVKRGKIVDFVEKPFSKTGRRLDRVIKSVLALAALQHHPAFKQLLVEQPALMENLLPTTLSSTVLQSMSCARSELTALGRPVGDAAMRQLITVTEAAALLLDVVSGIDLGKAKARVSKAADRGKFQTNGQKGGRRRIELDSFNTWRFKQRHRDLEAADRDLL